MNRVGDTCRCRGWLKGFQHMVWPLQSSTGRHNIQVCTVLCVQYDEHAQELFCAACADAIWTLLQHFSTCSTCLPWFRETGRLNLDTALKARGRGGANRNIGLRVSLRRRLVQAPVQWFEEHPGMFTSGTVQHG